MILIDTLVVFNLLLLLASMAALVVLGFMHSVILGSVMIAYLGSSILMRMLVSIKNEMEKLPGNKRG